MHQGRRETAPSGDAAHRMIGNGHRAAAGVERLMWRVAPGKMIQRALPRPDPELESVYLKRRLILIHIPKNAGTSVEDAIYGYHVRHRTWAEVRDLCPLAWATLPKIAIVRDPVDRFLSAYDYLRGGGRNAADRAFAQRMVIGHSAAQVAARLAGRSGFRRIAMQFFHFRPQSDYVSDGATAMVDHLIPITHMAEGLQRYAGLPRDALRHANRTGGHRTDRASLDAATVAQIEAVYATDRALYDGATAAWAAQYITKPKARQAGTPL